MSDTGYQPPGRQVRSRTIHPDGVLEEEFSDGSHRYTAPEAYRRSGRRETRAASGSPQAELDARWDRLTDLILGR